MSDKEPTVDPARDEIEERRMEVLDNQPLYRLFSKPSVSRIFVALVNTCQDMSISAIADHAGVARNSVRDNLGVMQEFNLIEHTRKQGGAKLYRLNTDSEETKALIAFRHALRE